MLLFYDQDRSFCSCIEKVHHDCLPGSLESGSSVGSKVVKQKDERSAPCWCRLEDQLAIVDGRICGRSTPRITSEDGEEKQSIVI